MSNDRQERPLRSGKEMEMENSFIFSFRDKWEDNKNYVASYSRTTGLKITPFKRVISIDHKTIDKRKLPIYKNKAWEIFYQNATFKDILKAIKNDSTSWSEMESFLNDSHKLSEIQFLSFIGDNPITLKNDSISDRLINILERAKWGSKNERNDAKKNLKLHLITKHKGGKKQRANLNCPLTLLKNLARNLSKICKKILRAEGYLTSKEDIDYYWADAYKKLHPNLIKNKHISWLSKDDLKFLVFHYSEYAKKQLMSHLNIRERTLINSAK